jgi:hypothetical protein
MSKATFSGETRRININTGQTAIDVKLDLYSDWKGWMLEGDNAKYLPAFSTTGGDAISDSESVGDYYFLENGWKIKPQEANHVLTVTGNLFSRDGSSPFVETDGSFNVSVRSKYAALTNQISTGIMAGPDAGEIAIAVLEAILSGHTPAGSLGASLMEILNTVRDNQALILSR